MDGSTMTTEEAPVSAIAQQCLRDAGGDIHKAQKLLEGLVRGHPPLYRNLMDPLLATACYDAITKVIRADRQKVWTAPNYTKAGNGQRLETMATTLLDFPLPNGVLMRHATKDDLLAAADFYAKQAKDMQHKGAWIAAIAAKVGKKTVGERFTAEQLAKLREETA